MDQFKYFTNEDQLRFKTWSLWGLYFIIFCIAIFISLYFYSQALIRVETPKPEFGDKVIITLPEGKTVYTFENLLVEEKGKLLYKGELNTIDLTGGEVSYENWE